MACYSHEVVETVALSSGLECHLVADCVLYIFYAVGLSGKGRNGVEGVGLALSATTGMDADGVGAREVTTVELHEVTGTEVFVGLVVVDIVVAESVLQDGECALRISGTVECLGIAQVDRSLAIDGNAVREQLALSVLWSTAMTGTPKL